MFTLAYGHALRTTEVASLTLEDVRGGKIRCRRNKGSQHTTEVLRRHEVEVLTAWLRERGDADGSCFLFRSREGSRLHRSQVYRLFRKIMELANLEKTHMGAHLLKHAYAAHMIRAGVNLAFVQKAMGHTHVSSTVKYTHVSTSEAQAKSNDVVASVLG